MDSRPEWTLDAIHERIAACDTMMQAVREAEEPHEWISAAPLALLGLMDEVLDGRFGGLKVPNGLIRRLKRLDPTLSEADLSSVLSRIKSRLRLIESNLAPDAPEGLRVVGKSEVYARAEPPVPAPAAPRLVAPIAERWRALPAHGAARGRAANAVPTLRRLALMLKAANASPALPFEGLEVVRAAITFDAAAQMLASPLVETGLLRCALRNAQAIRQTARDNGLLTTAKKVTDDLELVVSDLA